MNTTDNTNESSLKIDVHVCDVKDERLCVIVTDCHSTREVSIYGTLEMQ